MPLNKETKPNFEDLFKISKGRKNERKKEKSTRGLRKKEWKINHDGKERKKERTSKMLNPKTVI